MKINRCISMLLALALSPSIAGNQAQAQHPHSGSSNPNGISRAMGGNELSQLLAQLHHERRSGFALMPTGYGASPGAFVLNITPLAAGPNLPVLGGGTIGRLTKWTGLSSSNLFIGDTTIFEDKYGNVGIGTDTPTSKLTVAGMIENTLGGLKFPDGTVQTTSSAGAILTVTHDTTLTGSGTVASPLGVASPLMVRDLDNPARQPAQATATCSPSANDPRFCATTVYTVPAGKRLVIEFVAMRARGIPVGTAARLEIITIAGGQEAIFDFPFSAPVPESFGEGNIAQVVRIYADAGTRVLTAGFRSGESNDFNSNFTFSISGYLVNIP